ncbi:uncharacterized protein LOC121264710 [Juglans microcarpa x Juglans regia]|uniref:uncharacterized protein LOC121264710 n=1 Tax=Juglans microcarpa x Juglans regia TaxID=2249226 RepID=UPI001B7F240C|nr:uncharacterized protein LOC121264710 [Juglans microcarpa x Juglans regia]
MEELALTLWNLWKRRNEKVFNNVMIDPKSVQQMQLDLTVIEANTENQRHSRSSLRTQTWETPPSGFCKVNWDVAVDKTHFKIGIGISVRDEEGNYLATMRKNQLLNPDPLMAEAVGALTAATFALELDMNKIILEGDSELVIARIQKQTQDQSYFGMITSDIRSTISLFEVCITKHVNRECNVIAHNLAKNALLDYIVNLEETPHCVSNMY